MTWVCTVCNTPSHLTLPTPLLDGSYGTARCLVCKKRRIFREVNRDADKRNVAERPEGSAEEQR